MILRKLDLTPDQHAQIHKIMESDHASLRDLVHQLEAANRELADKLFVAGDLQAADLAPQAQKITDLRRQLMEHGLKTALAIRGVLTPDQLAKAAELKTRLEKLRSEMRELMGPGEGDRP